MGKDITKSCLTFPILPSEEIFRDNLVNSLQNEFSPDKQAIVVEGTPSSGKTILLSQFARAQNQRTFSFFIGEDYWSSGVPLFLSDLCSQMRQIKTINISQELLDLDINSLQEHQLIHLFSKLYQSVISLARKGFGPYYFVIDGINNVSSNYGENNILKYIPNGNEYGVFVLLSNNKGVEKLLPFKPTTWALPMFSLPETEKYLKHLLLEDEIKKIQSMCEGVPGYLSEIKTQLSKGCNKKDVLDDLPKGFANFLEREWSHLDINDDITLKILALVTYSLEPLTINSVSEILGIGIGVVKERINSLSFCRQNIDNHNLDLGSYKIILTKKLGKYKTFSIQSLINHYENIGSQQSTSIYLPILYKQSENFDALVNLINVENMIQILQDTNRVSVIRRNLSILAEMAFLKKDWQKMCWAILAESVFSYIIESAPAMESQIKALLALAKTEDAQKMAYACKLPEDRLQLLSDICSFKSSRGETIPNDILISLEDCVNTMDITLNLTGKALDKLLDICVNIFSVKSDVAFRLIERIGEEVGLKSMKDHLMDVFLARLMLRLGPNSENLDKIGLKIKDERIHDFAKFATTPLVVNESTILEQIENVSDTSIKIFLLQQWCNANKDNDSAHIVVDKAIGILENSEDYTPSHFSMRIFANSLSNCTDENAVKVLTKRIDSLKATLIKNPIDELTRLELALATIENKFDHNHAVERLYNVYFTLSEINDIDIKCLILVRLINQADILIPEDISLIDEMRTELIKEYDILMANSASQYRITEKILSALSETDPSLAIKFAERINLESRRDNAYQLILKIYTQDTLDKIDFDFIDTVLERIKDNYLRMLVVREIIKRFSEETGNCDINQKKKFISQIIHMKSSIIRAYTFAYLLVWIHDGDIDTYTSISPKIVDFIENIDPYWQRVSLGFEISSIIATKDRILANKIYEQSIKQQSDSLFSDERLSLIYIEICHLTIRMIPDIIKDNFKEYSGIIKKAIMCVPSIYYQCVLISNMSLKCLHSGNNDAFMDMATSCLQIIDTCNDSDIIEETLIHIAPMIYEYERSLLYDKLKHLDIQYRDHAYENVIRYIYSKRPPSDPFDNKSLSDLTINIADINKICEILDKIETDSLIYSIISDLSTAIIDYRGRSIQSNLTERQLLLVVEKLSNIIKEKLPENRNILHDGYIVLCTACLAKLRTVASKSTSYRAKEIWKTVCPTWEQVLQHGLSITNIADRAFVLAYSGEDAHEVNSDKFQLFLEEAEKSLRSINNRIDRVERFSVVSKAYNNSRNKATAQAILDEAVTTASSFDINEGRDSFLGELIEIAYNIDPNYANLLSQRIDDLPSKAFVTERLCELNLHSDPKKIEQYKSEQSKRILKNVYDRLLTSLCSGRGIVQHDETVGKYLYQTLGNDFETVILGLFWYIENIIARKSKSSNVSNLHILFSGLIQLLELIARLSGIITDISATSENTRDYFFSCESFAPDVVTIGVGQKEQALKIIKNWLTENVSDYVKIYDPYFNEDAIEILKYIPSMTRVTIITSLKLANLDVLKIKEKYREAWSNICDQNPPESLIYFLSTPSGKTPMHDRFILSANTGLQLGTSLNGYGNKDSTITFLDKDKKYSFEKDIVDYIIASPPVMYKDERLTIKTLSFE